MTVGSFHSNWQLQKYPEKSALERRNSTSRSNRGSPSRMAFKATRTHKQHWCSNCFTRCYSFCCHKNMGECFMQCTDCSKSTAELANLIHQRIHCEKRPFHCSDRMWQFVSDANIQYNQHCDKKDTHTHTPE